MADALAGHIEELKEAYGAVTTVTAPSGETYFKIENVKLPKGCEPTITPALLVVKGEARPQLYVKPGIKVPNGIAPRSTSTVELHGEAWLQFSYTFPWEWGTHTLVQFVGSSLRRFARPE
jgi:hypothetical protein